MLFRESMVILSFRVSRISSVRLPEGRGECFRLIPQQKCKILSPRQQIRVEILRMQLLLLSPLAQQADSEAYSIVSMRQVSVAAMFLYCSACKGIGPVRYSE